MGAVAHCSGPCSCSRFIYLLTSILTEVVTVQRSGPYADTIAIASRNSWGRIPRPFVLAVHVCASASFATGRSVTRTNHLSSTAPVGYAFLLTFMSASAFPLNLDSCGHPRSIVIPIDLATLPRLRPQLSGLSSICHAGRNCCSACGVPSRKRSAAVLTWCDSRPCVLNCWDRWLQYRQAFGRSISFRCICAAGSPVTGTG